MSFNELNINSKIVNNLTKIGFDSPTPIQKLVINIAGENKNILGCAQTGTGKTAAFGVSIVEKLIKNRKEGFNNRELTTLVIAPTRELASQIHENIRKFSENLNIKTLAIYGGSRDRNKHIFMIKKGLDLVVATPGRLLDYVQSRVIDLSKVNTVVIDEADLMMDMGFINEIKMILKATREDKQIMLFSATMPKQIMNLVKEFMNEYEYVATETFSKPIESIEHIAYYHSHTKAFDILKNIILNEKIYMGIIFTKTKRDADFLETSLRDLKINCVAFHGDKNQGKRSAILKDFRKGKIQFLIATDVASRGIDVEDISHVFNFNIPEDPEVYTHRVGRTGRAEKAGKAISIFSKKDFPYLAKIEKQINMPIPKVKVHLEDEELIQSEFLENLNSSSFKFDNKNGDRRYKSSYKRNDNDFFSRRNDRESSWKRNDSRQSNFQNKNSNFRNRNNDNKSFYSKSPSHTKKFN